MPNEEPTAAAEPEPSPGIPEMMDEDELCELLDISHATAWRLRKARRLGYSKYGVKIRYLRRHVVAFLDAHEVPASAERPRLAMVKNG